MFGSDEKNNLSESIVTVRRRTENPKKKLPHFHKLRRGIFVKISQQNSKRAGFVVHGFFQMLINFAPTARDRDFPMAKEGLEFGCLSIF